MKMDKWLYYAFQLSESSKRQLHEYVSTQLSEQLQWMDKLYLDHCTLLHRSQYNNERAVLIKKRLDLLLRTGKTRFTLQVNKVGVSYQAMAFKLVKSSFLSYVCFNQIPHITIGTTYRGKPVDSNQITDWFDMGCTIGVEVELKIFYA